jgi:hypothetical protein
LATLHPEGKTNGPDFIFLLNIVSSLYFRLSVDKAVAFNLKTGVPFLDRASNFSSSSPFSLEILLTTA